MRTVAAEKLCVYLRLATVLLLLLQSACAIQVERHSRTICPDCTRHMLASSGPAPLMVYSRNVKINSGDQELWHIYLEGDGTPFLRPALPASNPSRSNLLALQLMTLDKTPSIYLNRPCYGFDTIPANCRPALWTSQRYSAAVVQYLDEALTEIKLQFMPHNSQLIIIGHSGGGALALLLAARRQDIIGVVTLAGNVDTDAWTQLHHFTPLVHSLNPVQQMPLPAHIKRWHLAGEQDQNIPVPLLKKALQQDPHAVVRILPDTTHNKGWLEHWPAILREMETIK